MSRKSDNRAQAKYICHRAHTCVIPRSFSRPFRTPLAQSSCGRSVRLPPECRRNQGELQGRAVFVVSRTPNARQKTGLSVRLISPSFGKSVSAASTSRSSVAFAGPGGPMPKIFNIIDAQMKVHFLASFDRSIGDGLRTGPARGGRRRQVCQKCCVDDFLQSVH